MRMKTVGNKRDMTAIVIKSAEASATIAAGAPVCFAMNGTDDGLAVVLPGTGGAVKTTSFAAGVALSSIVAGGYGESQVFGFCPNIILRRQTRAATTDAFSSNSDGFATGLLLLVDTINNAFSTAASVAVSMYAPLAVLAESVASWASSASTTSETRTVITVATKAMIRMM